MKEIIYNSLPLIVLQRWVYRLVFIYYAAIVIMLFAGSAIAGELAFWGVIAILVMTLAKAFVMAVVFLKGKLYRHSLLVFVMILILLSTVILRNWMQ